jgi:hypothetical protein
MMSEVGNYEKAIIGEIEEYAEIVTQYRKDHDAIWIIFVEYGTAEFL